MWGPRLGSDGVIQQGGREDEAGGRAADNRQLLEGRLPLGSGPEPGLKAGTCVNRRLPMVLTV